MKTNTLMTTNSFNELTDELTKISNMTSIDNVLVPGQEVLIKHVYSRGKLQRIGVHCDKRTLYRNETKQKGAKYSDYINSIKATEEIAEIATATIDEPAVSVLALRKMDSDLTHDGKITTHWVEFDVVDLYDVEPETNVPVFRSYSVSLSREDTARLTATKIAFKHGDQLYGIAEKAIPSIGRLLDANSAFSRLDDGEVSFFLAGEIAAKLNFGQTLSLICNNYEGDVKLIQGVAGSRFVPIRQDELFKRVYNYIVENMSSYVAEVKNWDVTLEQTTICLKLNTMLFADNYERGLILNTSDLSDTSINLTAYVKVCGATAYLKKNTLRHNKPFSDASIEILFNEIPEAFQMFEQNLYKLNEGTYTLTLSDISEIKKCIGKFRMERLNNSVPLSPCTIPKTDIFPMIICNESLSTKQENELRDFYGKVLLKMLN